MYTRLMIDQHKFVQISMIKDKTTVSIGTDFTFTESVWQIEVTESVIYLTGNFLVNRTSYWSLQNCVDFVAVLDACRFSLDI